MILPVGKSCLSLLLSVCLSVSLPGSTVKECSGRSKDKTSHKDTLL